MDELDRYVNEIFKRSSVTSGVEDFSDAMGRCRLTRDHLPDEVIGVLFGDQLLSGADVSKFSAVQLQNILAPGKEMLKPMTDKWMGKQTVYDDSLTKPAERKVNKIAPEVGDIIRKRLSQSIELLLPVGGTALCDGLLAITKAIKGYMAAFAYAVGTPSTEAATTVNVNLDPILRSTYSKAANQYYNHPGLNYRRVREIMPIDFVFFPRLASAISTRTPAQITLKLAEEDTRAFKQSMGNVKNISNTERLFEDFFDAAFSASPGGISQLKQVCAPEINKGNQEILKLQTSPREEIKTELIADYITRADASLKNIYRLVQALRPPEVHKILSILTTFQNSIL